MTSFKKLVDGDIERVFVNLNDFAEMHTIDIQDGDRDDEQNEETDEQNEEADGKKEIMCVLDSDEYSQRSPELGVESAGFNLYARASDLGERREAGNVMVIDDRLYIIQTWQENMGLAQIKLMATHSG